MKIELRFKGQSPNTPAILITLMVNISAHLQLAFNWIALLNALDLNGMASVMSENFTNQLRPTSMGFASVGKEEYLVRIAAIPVKYFNVC
jgi:hypothetical protein